MSNTRINFEADAYSHSLYESTAPQNYLLLPESSYRPDTCSMEDPEFRPTSRKVFNIAGKNQLVDMESDLKNLNRKESKNPLTQYPYTKKEYHQEILETCPDHMSLRTRHSLLEAPSYKREQQVDIPRFESLARNHQRLNRIRSNNYIGVNTRLHLRDSHVPKIPKVMDQQKLLPKPDVRKGTSLDDFFSDSVKLPF